MDEVDREEDSGGGSSEPVHPVGLALRSTFGADNHDTLGCELTGLMIDLSRVPFDAADGVAKPVVVSHAMSVVVPPLAMETPAKAGRLRRLIRVLSRR